MTATERPPDRGGGKRLPAEVVSDLLEDDACRRILSYLATRDEPVAVEEVGRALAAAERDVAPERVDPETASAYRDAVFQRHLPKLTPTGVVSYNSMLGTVALDTTDERLLSALE